MKFFAFALLVAAVAAEDAARSARSLVGFGHGLVAPNVVSVAHGRTVIVSPGVVSVAHGVPSWVHGVHRRSVGWPAVVPFGHGVAPVWAASVAHAPAPVLAHGTAVAYGSHIRHGRSLWAVGHPAVVGHPSLVAPVAVAPVAVAHVAPVAYGQRSIAVGHGHVALAHA